MLRKNLLSKKGMVFLALVLFFGAICFGSISTAIAEPVCEGDFDYDGDVDGPDLAVFAEDFGRVDCPSGGPAPVEKTGQTTSYGTGDDGDLEKGVALPNTAGTGKWSEGNPFSLVEPSWYWTSTGYTYSDAWALSLSTGHVSNYSKTTDFYVWCVRDGN